MLKQQSCSYVLSTDHGCIYPMTMNPWYNLVKRQWLLDDQDTFINFYCLPHLSYSFSHFSVAMRVNRGFDWAYTIDILFMHYILSIDTESLFVCLLSLSRWETTLRWFRQAFEWRAKQIDFKRWGLLLPNDWACLNHDDFWDGSRELTRSKNEFLRSKWASVIV